MRRFKTPILEDMGQQELPFTVGWVQIDSSSLENYLKCPLTLNLNLLSEPATPPFDIQAIATSAYVHQKICAIFIAIVIVIAPNGK